jgi:phage shock protein A
MGLMQRFANLFRAKSYTLMERMEDPRETLDY